MVVVSDWQSSAFEKPKSQIFSCGTGPCMSSVFSSCGRMSRPAGTLVSGHRGRCGSGRSAPGGAQQQHSSICLRRHSASARQHTLRSRWTTIWEWRYATPEMSCWNRKRALFSLSCAPLAHRAETNLYSSPPAAELSAAGVSCGSGGMCEARLTSFVLSTLGRTRLPHAPSR